MVVGVGIDIIDVKRIQSKLAAGESDLKQVLFTPEENTYCETKRFPGPFYAARFAAKEAFLKALGTGLRGGITWQDLEVVHDSLGKPELRLAGRALQLACERQIGRIHLSISHIKDSAVAVVILENSKEV